MEASQYKHVGRAMVGIALVLVSLGMIKTVAEPLKQSEALHLMLGPLTSQPLLAITLSALMTWLVHSSLGITNADFNRPAEDSMQRVVVTK